MKVVKYLSQVDPNNCKGDKLCERVCPTRAIKVQNRQVGCRIAEVDAATCVGCGRCEDICPKGAARLIPLEEPRVIQCDSSDVDAAKINDLCRKAHMYPKQFICFCTGTQTHEVAAAIIKGAKTVEDVTLMTGIRSGCDMYCQGPVLRLMHAAGLAVNPPKDEGWIDLSLSMWDLGQELDKKYPIFHIEEEKRVWFKEELLDKIDKSDES